MNDLADLLRLSPSQALARFEQSSPSLETLTFAGCPVPPIPGSPGPNKLPPATSQPIVIAAALARTRVIVPSIVGSAFVNIYIEFIRYWQQIFYQIADGPATVRQSLTVTEGLSIAETESLSRQLGLSGKGLSAALSETFARTITISTSRSLTVGIDATIKEGTTAGVALWQLVDTFQFLDAKHIVLPAAGKPTFIFVFYQDGTTGYYPFSVYLTVQSPPVPLNVLRQVIYPLT